MGRTAVGVRGIRLREGDYVVGAALAQPGKTVLSITERGFGKRTPVEEYRITARGGLGIRNYMVTEKTGPIVGIKVVDGAEDLLLVTQAGILIRTAVGISVLPAAPPRASLSCALRRKATASSP